jgi:hypothetical protein
VVRSDIWCTGDHFRLPLAQPADICCTLINGTPLLIFTLAREPASSPAALFCSSHSRNFFASALFFRDEIRRQRFVEEKCVLVRLIERLLYGAGI